MTWTKQLPSTYQRLASEGAVKSRHANRQHQKRTGRKEVGRRRFCNKCRCCKTAQGFYKDNRKPGRLRKVCKSCENKRHYEYCLKNKKRIRQWFREWQKNNPERVRLIRKRSCRVLRMKRKQFPEIYRKKDKQYRDSHKEQCEKTRRKYYLGHIKQRRKYARKYNQIHKPWKKEFYKTYMKLYWKLHPEKNRNNVKQWRENNPDKYKAHLSKNTARRRARLRDAKGSFSLYDVLAILKKQNYRCFYCGKNIKARYQIEHKNPLSRGGSNFLRNICCVCPRCNRRKGNKTLQEFKKIRRQYP